MSSTEDLVEIQDEIKPLTIKELAKDLPDHVAYWMTADSKNDCFFILGSTTERIGAIKIFLIGYSEPLRKMLDEGNLVENGDICLPDIEPETFRIFLMCVYGGHNSVIKSLSFQQSVNLLYMVDKYLVTVLKNGVVEHLLELLPLDLDNVSIALSKVAVILTVKCLQKTLEAIVQQMTKDIITAEAFVNIHHDGLLWLVKQECLNVDEVTIWEAVLKWAKHQCDDGDKTVREYILNHLKYIRFCTMSCEDFCTKVIVSNVLQPEEIRAICEYFASKEPPNMAYVCNSFISREPLSPKIVEKATFYHVVNNIRELEGREKSMEFKCNGVCWNILVIKKNNNFGLFLDCNGTKIPNWNIHAAVKLTLVNQYQSVPDISKDFDRTFCSKESSWGFSHFIEWDELVEGRKGFVKDNTIIVKARLDVS